VEDGTILDVFERTAGRLHDRPALRRRVGEAWETLTWADYAQAVRETSAGLVELGLRSGDRAAVLSGNRIEWHVADLGILAAGGVSVPVYPNSAAAQVSYVLDHAECRFCFVDTPERLAALASASVPGLEHIIVSQGAGPFPDQRAISFATLRELGAERAKRELSIDARARGIDPDDLATLVYTSGTTGQPKGTMLTHGNITWTLASLAKTAPLQPGERFLSFLPLSHIAERMVSHFLQIYAGGETWFARDLTTVPDDLRDCRPTIFFGVPRVYEKARAAILEEIAHQSAPKQAMAQMFLSLAVRDVASESGGAPLSNIERRFHRFLDGIVGAKVREGLGLDRARLVFSGAAPIAPAILAWFHAIGLPVAEVYGQTESCGPTTLNPPERIRIGTVGLPIPGLELRCAADGEILVRGANLCQGYFKDPEATALLFDLDGWMHTGDLGESDPDGYVRIIGRKKDIIITSGGKNVAPQEFENRLKLERIIAEAVVLGDARPYLVALITLDVEAAMRFVAERGHAADADTLASNPEILSVVAEAIERLNSGVSPAERIKRWRILRREFSVEAGELTPTLKLRRHSILEQHADVVDELYAEELSFDQG
jgi:long-chain acyl-CoA synthetase